MGFSWSFMIAMGWYDIYVTTQAVNTLCGIDQIHNREFLRKQPQINVTQHTIVIWKNISVTNNIFLNIFFS